MMNDGKKGVGNNLAALTISLFVCLQCVCLCVIEMHWISWRMI